MLKAHDRPNTPRCTAIKEIVGRLAENSYEQTAKEFERYSARLKRNPWLRP